MINPNRIDCIVDPDGSIAVYVPPNVARHFKTMVTRALSTWQMPHPEVRDFADRLSGLDKVVTKQYRPARLAVTKEGESND